MVFFVIATSVLVIAGCAPFPAPNKKESPVTCASKYFFGREQPLGSLFRFSDDALAAAKAMSPTTVANIARSAGWQDGGWDRIVDVPQEITSAELDRRTGTTGICWENLPHRIGSEYDNPSVGEYLFLNGDQPVQNTPWYEPYQRPFDFDGRDFISADTPLVANGKSGRLRPE
ncbi:MULTISPECIES: hypothetical protein [Nocardia]|uniref:hypothetical protein n=1 Tax=Nocardia TaxID=1817 RepID=UPI001300B74E|nr:MULTISPECIES: hypothetical protein [Nocardia]